MRKATKEALVNIGKIYRSKRDGFDFSAPSTCIQTNSVGINYSVRMKSYTLISSVAVTDTQTNSVGI